jgi:hypothetical protein
MQHHGAMECDRQTAWWLWVNSICDSAMAWSVVWHVLGGDVVVAVRIICLAVASTFRSIIKSRVVHAKTMCANAAECPLGLQKGS